MPSTTSRGLFPYPDGIDNWKQLRSYIRSLADRAGLAVTLFGSGTASARPTAVAERVGMVWYSTDTGAVDFCTGTAWRSLIAVTVRVPHTFTLSGEVKVATGDDFYVPPFFVAAPGGQTVRLAAARHRINSGTSATVELRRNGTAVTGFTGLAVTPATATTDPADVALADGDALSLVVTAVSGTPRNLSFTVWLDVTV